jgi:diguanylate cyclase (GGDEF)-like protein/putative nucleotidyltransferase with HDIG domain
MRQIPTAPKPLSSPGAGLFRIALTGIIALLLSRILPGSEGAYVAVGLAVLFGVSLILGRPEVLLRERLAHVVLDSLVIGVLIAFTGGGDSPFFPLYLLAALGIAWIEARPKVVVATAAVVGGYLAAVVVSGGPEALGSAPVALKAGFLALFCGAVAFLGSEMNSFRKLAIGLSSTLANEIDRVESDETLISRLGPVLKTLSLEGILEWTVEAAHAVGGGPYAHVAALNGNHHRSIMEGDFDVCPSWWHPSIQRLLLRSCREGEIVRSEEEIHGIEGFMAVPIGLEDEKWGAIIVGGGEYGAEEERAIKLLAEEIASALEDAYEAPGGLDQLTGLPNRASLHHILRRELSHGRVLTILAMDLEGFRDYERTHGLAAGEAILRRIGQRLKDSSQRTFHGGDGEFVVVLGGSGEARARKLGLALQQRVSEETGNSGHSPLRAAVGFAYTRTGEEDPDLVLRTALRALEDARGRAERIAGLTAGAGARTLDDIKGDERVVGIARTLVEALEAKDPYIRDHLRAVSRLALRIGHQLGLQVDEMEALTTGALLHDVGKIGVPDLILQKSGRLTEEEYTVIKRHPALGVEIIAPVKELASALPVVRHHHERFDGKGYPDGLRGEDIPLIARIVSVADAFDSMIRARPYGYGISRKAALQEIEENSGTQFDPRIVRALLEVIDATGDRQADTAG